MTLAFAVNPVVFEITSGEALWILQDHHSLNEHVLII